MNVVEFPNFAPSICFICEGCPEGVKYADTAREFQPGFPSTLTGHKYVCESCARDHANALGLFDEATQALKDRVVELENEVLNATADRELIESFVATAERIAADHAPRKAAVKRATK